MRRETCGRATVIVRRRQHRLIGPAVRPSLTPSVALSCLSIATGLESQGRDLARRPAVTRRDSGGGGGRRPGGCLVSRSMAVVVPVRQLVSGGQPAVTDQHTGQPRLN